MFELLLEEELSESAESAESRVASAANDARTELNSLSALALAFLSAAVVGGVGNVGVATASGLLPYLPLPRPLPRPLPAAFTSVAPGIDAAGMLTATAHSRITHTVYLFGARHMFRSTM